MKIKRLKYIDSSLNAEQTDMISKPVTIEIVGFVVEETKEHITLAMEIIDGEDYRGQVSIPKVAIIQ